MAAQSPLRRWKRFYRLFDTIDAAIVASQRKEEIVCAEVLRQAKGAAVQLLCDASEDDPAEECCWVLDNVMADYLITLQTVPVTPSALTSTDLAKAVGTLQEHESEQIRDLARDMVAKWRASVESDIGRSVARLEVFCKLCDEELPAEAKSRPSVARGDLVEMAKNAVPKNIARVVCAGRANAASTDKKMVPKKMPAITGSRVRDHADINKMEATKQKPHTGYQEAEDAKLQRKIVVNETPKMVKQQHRKMVEQPYRSAEDAKISAPVFKMSAPVVGAGLATTDKKMPAMEATKRKLLAGYQEEAEAKRQRKIIVIEAPKTGEQPRRKMHPIVRGRSQATRRP